MGARYAKIHSLDIEAIEIPPGPLYAHIKLMAEYQRTQLLICDNINKEILKLIELNKKGKK